MAEINFVKPKAIVKHQTLREKLKSNKKAFISAAAVGGGVILVMLVAILVINLMRVDYSATYTKMREVKEKTLALLKSDACQDVAENVKGTSPTVEEYKRLVRRCKNTSEGVLDLVNEFSETEGVKRNGEIRAKYEEFRKELLVAFPELEQADFSQKLDLYQLWHEYIVEVSTLTYSDSREEFEQIAKPLIESGDETIAEYGENWLRRTLSVLNAYTEYEAAGRDSAARIELRAVYERRKKAQDEWDAENRPDITEILPLKFGDGAAAENKMNELSRVVAEAAGEEDL